ncbi:L-rhamnose mutarotase [Alteromonas sp. MMG017]|uniref:L-rhamnose mutarotase n=1 Tax=Alteromonas sp. MMG017 TaxID=2822692 RepID=UPI001B3A417C|nr:L-rhamnose mutarotase [Alteromonas sp. MMG017]MBQ4828479.1 L-rhamnose mutarotase [Alteromonas sp. MMG017]
MTHKRYCLALDLIDDPALIEQYLAFHTPDKAWPQITQNMREMGIVDMEIYHLGDRLFMIMETNEHYDPNAEPATPEGRAKSNEWEALMWQFQKPLPWAEEGQKWVEMNKIYDLKLALT